MFIFSGASDPNPHLRGQGARGRPVTRYVWLHCSKTHEISVNNEYALISASCEEQVWNDARERHKHLRRRRAVDWPRWSRSAGPAAPRARLGARDEGPWKKGRNPTFFVPSKISNKHCLDEFIEAIEGLAGPIMRNALMAKLNI